ncbi:histidine kinase [Nostoc sp. CENA543]|uniref:NACHT domain-containing protein n=1 Tax=Nostoc sp. CENA543 TaxID=1869241 RepID=UPI000CA2ABE2|nr:histidine kinase [Nostoc sp. CENA543]
MAKRSLQASDEGIRKAKQAFKRKGWTQEYLAAEVGLETRQPIWKFFTGKPIDRHVFHDICCVLDLETSEIAQNIVIDEETEPETQSDSPIEHHQTTLDIDVLVQKLRSIHHERIQAQCGTLHLLDIAKPINLNDIYIDVNIFEEISSYRWVNMNDLQNPESYEKKGFAINRGSQARISGLDAVRKYAKMLVFGKPGSGKTTFLQSLALICNRGFFQPNYLPIFINLKNFTEDTREYSQLSLFNYIYEYFVNFDVADTELTTVLDEGKALILLDGLDEIIGEDADIIINKIRIFIEKFYKNQIIITCRFAYHLKFRGFTEVEIADFNKNQIAAFAQRWFLAFAKNSPVQAQVLANKFMQKLLLAENAQILELATTPILLNLTCLVFQSREDFPTDHSQLYKQALDLLLVRWDESRGIKRDQVYRQLSLADKIKLLCHIASVSFRQGIHFISATRLQQIIAVHLASLPNATHDTYALEIESKSVIRAIEIQHGLLIERARDIYSFSHLSFQEYFAARDIVANINNKGLEELVCHLYEPRWREVFLLSVGMLNNADDLLLLIKSKIDELPHKNRKLHDFLQWLKQKSDQVTTIYHCASVRAFYFTISLPPEHPLAGNQDLAISLDRQLASSLNGDLAIDLALTHALAVSLRMTAEIFSQRIGTLKLALDLKYLLNNQASWQTLLQEVTNKLPRSHQDRKILNSWWKNHGRDWTEELRSLMMTHRQIGYDWQFNQQDLQYLQHYWNANKLLLDCLKAALNINYDVKNYLEKSLFSQDNFKIDTHILDDSIL